MKQIDIEDVKIGQRLIYAYEEGDVVDLITVTNKKVNNIYFNIDAVFNETLTHRPGKILSRGIRDGQRIYLNTPENMKYFKEKYNITDWIK